MPYSAWYSVAERCQASQSVFLPAATFSAENKYLAERNERDKQGNEQPTKTREKVQENYAREFQGEKEFPPLFFHFHFCGSHILSM